LTDLRRDLEEKEGDWIVIGNPTMTPAAPIHNAKVEGRSVVSIMFRHAGGRKAGLDYLERLRVFAPAWVSETNVNTKKLEPRLNPDLPQFPDGSQWAMVRRMMLIDSERKMQPSPIVESIRLRTFLKTSARPDQPGPSGQWVDAQKFQVFVMSGPAAKLRAVREGEKEFQFVQAMSLGWDPFESRNADFRRDSSKFQQETVKSCATCHGQGPGIFNVFSFIRDPSFFTTQFVAMKDWHDEAQATIGWKKRQYSWGLFQGLMAEQPLMRLTREASVDVLATAGLVAMDRDNVAPGF
jgi:hypothetical protein